MASKRCKNTGKWRSYCLCGSSLCGKSMCKHRRIRCQCKECGGFPVLAKQMFWSARRRAKRDKQAFCITVTDILKMIGNGICPVLGVRYDLTSHGGGIEASATLDKFIPKQGYTKRNCCVISKLANLIKANANVKQVQQVANWMKQRTQNKKS